MAARSPTSATVPLGRPDNEAADLWDRLVSGGMDPAQATALVQASTGAMPRDVTAVSTPTFPAAQTMRAAPEQEPERFMELTPRPRGLIGSIGRDLDAVARTTVGNVARLLPGVEGGPAGEDYGRAIRGVFTVLDPVGTFAETAVASVLEWIAGVPDHERRSLLARAYEEGAFDAALRATGMEDAFERWAEQNPRIGLAATIGGSALGGSAAEGMVRGAVRGAGRRAAREIGEEVAERVGREAAGRVVQAPNGRWGVQDDSGRWRSVLYGTPEEAQRRLAELNEMGVFDAGGNRIAAESSGRPTIEQGAATSTARGAGARQTTRPNVANVSTGHDALRRTWFHGTGKDFDEFDDAFRASGAGGAGTDAGFWFTSEEDAAKLYADYVGRGQGQVMRADIRAENPLVIDVEEIVEREARGLGADIIPDDAPYHDKYQIVFPDADVIGDLIHDAIIEAKAKGHDAVLFRNIIDNPKGITEETRFANDPQDHIVVFDSRAIRKHTPEEIERAQLETELNALRQAARFAPDAQRPLYEQQIAEIEHRLAGSATPAATAALGLAGAGGLALFGDSKQEDEMSSPNPQQATIPLGSDPRQTAARMWDDLVAQGVDPAEATLRVQQATGVQPRDTVDEALVRFGGPTREAAAESGATMPLPQQQRPRVDQSTARGALATGLQGLTFGLSDEFGAAVRSLPALLPGGQSFGEAYRENVEAARAGLEQFREEHPIGSIGTEILGGLAGGGAGAIRGALASGGRAALRSAGRSAAQRALAQPVVRGAVEGAVAGAGTAEGGLGDRTVGAVGGGILGGTTGGVITGLGALRGARGRAQGRFASALEREGVDDVAEALRGLQPGEMVMDLGETGGPLQRLARGAEAIPSEGGAAIRRALEERAAAAPTRIKETLQREARLTFEDAVQTVDDLVAQRAARARPFYREAYRYSVSDDVVRGLFDDPEFQRAYRLAQRTAAQEVGARQALAAAGLPIPDDLADAEVLPQLFRVTEEGKVEFLTKSIPVRALDYMKSALQEVIDQDIAGGRLSKRGAMMLKRKLDAFLARVDELVPEYRQARATFGGLSQAMEAFEVARTGSAERGLKAFLNEDPRRIAKVLSEMSPSEQAFYRRGALDAVRQRLESASDGRDLTRVIFGNTEMRNRIRTLFESEDDFMRFADAMERERRMAQGRQFILGGSPTARIQAEQAEMIAETPISRLTTALDALLAPVEAGRRGVRALGARAAVGGGARTATELAPFLMASADDAAGIADELVEAIRQEQIRDAILRAATGGFAIPAGLAAGRASN